MRVSSRPKDLPNQAGTGSVPHRTNLSLEPGVGLKPELFSTFLAFAPPGAIRLPGQNHRAADQLAGDPMERDGDKSLFHCLSNRVESSNDVPEDFSGLRGTFAPGGPPQPAIPRAKRQG